MSSLPLETEHGISQPSNNHNITSTSAINNNLGGGGGAVEVSKLIRKDLIFMKEAVAEVNRYMDGLNVKINQACDKFQELQTISTGSGSEIELHQLRKTIAKLKCRIPSNLHMRSSTDTNPILQNPWSDTSIDNSSSSNIQADHVNNASEDSTIDFEQIYDELYWEKRISLCCFLKFPKNAIIKKRLIVYWWIGAGLTYFSDKRRVQLANEFFDEFVESRLIEPVYEKRGLVADSCRIHPSLYSFLVDYANKNQGHERRVLEGIEKRCYLSDHHPNFGSATVYDGTELLSNLDPEKTILYLGRWQSSASHHIEVANMKFFDGLKNMTYLMFLSLRGISLITELPPYILKLTSLMILDLRACYNLETLPDRIDLLQNLTHLDASECYFLEQMPKALATLQYLEVLKGFAIGDSTGNTSCSLGDLARLPKLIKLNIYYRGVKNFPTNEQLGELQRFHVLEKLTISWGGNSTEIQSLESHNSQVLLSLPLHKLDLQGFPGTNVPNWLRPAKLKKLKKLYLRGGRLRDLQQFQSDEEIGVEILRFKYLSELDLDWGDLRRMFSSLKYLEIKECPNLTGFQCDKNGVWMNKAEN